MSNQNTFGKRLDIHANRDPFWGNKISLWLRLKEWSSDTMKVSYVLPLTLEAATPENECMERPPTMSLQPDEAQHLMDELWRCGLRPTEGSGSAGQLSAVQSHLADMRKMAFKACNIES